MYFGHLFLQTVLALLAVCIIVEAAVVHLGSTSSKSSSSNATTTTDNVARDSPSADRADTETDATVDTSKRLDFGSISSIFDELLNSQTAGNSGSSSSSIFGNSGNSISDPFGSSGLFGTGFGSSGFGSSGFGSSGSGSSTGSASGAGSTSSGQCGVQASGYEPQSQKDRFRIINGVEATPHSWPWIVYIKSGNSLCGGSLIRPNVVLTAAHCLVGASTHSTTVQVGAHTLFGGSDPGQTIRAGKIIVHSGYDNNGVAHDIGIIKLAQSAQLSAAVRTICLPSAGQQQQSSSDACVIAGWGRLNGRTNDLPTALQEANVPIVDNASCKRKLVGADIRDSMVCAGGRSQDSCQGDSGGPLMCKQGNTWTLLGLTSFGPSDCGTPGIPAVYTRISSYLDWINRNI